MTITVAVFGPPHTHGCSRAYIVMLCTYASMPRCTSRNNGRGILSATPP